MSKRQAFRKPTLPEVLTFVIGCVALFLIINLGQKWLICRDVLAEKQAVSKVVEAQRSHRDELKQELQAAQSDAHIEKIGREDFGLVKEQEGSVILEYPEGTSGAAPGTEPPAAAVGEAGPPYWLDWLKLFVSP